MERYDDELVKLLYQSNADAIRTRLGDLGEALHIAANDLSHDCTLERVDALLSRLKGAETSLVHLRKTLVVKC